MAEGRFTNPLAAVALPGSRLTDSGQDKMFLVNYLSNVILTQQLLKNAVIKLKKRVPRSKVIVISSDSHQGASYIDEEEGRKLWDRSINLLKNLEN